MLTPAACRQARWRHAQQAVEEFGGLLPRRQWGPQLRGWESANQFGTGDLSRLRGGTADAIDGVDSGTASGAPASAASLWVKAVLESSSAYRLWWALRGEFWARPWQGAGEGLLPESAGLPRFR